MYFSFIVLHYNKTWKFKFCQSNTIQQSPNWGMGFQYNINSVFSDTFDILFCTELFCFQCTMFLACSKVFVYCMVNNTRPYNLHKLKTLYDYVYSLSSKKCFSRTFYFKKIMIRDMRVKNQEFKKQIFDNNFCAIIFFIN